MINEDTVLFGVQNNINGITTIPEDDKRNIGFLLLNAGMLHRVGPQRLNVRIARELASYGYPSLRFDFSGLGDSLSGPTFVSSEKQVLAELQFATEYLVETVGVQAIVIIGICSGAEAGFHYAMHSNYVAGCLLINGVYLNQKEYHGIFDIAFQRTKARYYKKNLFKLSRWVKLFQGKSKLFSNKETLKNMFVRDRNSDTSDPKLEIQQSVSERHRHLLEKSVKLCYMFSEGSVAFDLYKLLIADWICESGFGNSMKIVLFENTDHLFTLIKSQNLLVQSIIFWVTDSFERRQYADK